MRVSYRSIVLPLLALLALSCPGDERAGGEPIRIAFAGPTSGPSAEDGLSAVRAIELVLERVNEAGGLGGRPIVLDVYDDANDPERARTNAPSIAEQSATLAVIGHNFSTCSIAAGEVYAARGLPAVSAAATSVAVTRDNPWYFRVIYDDRAQGRFVTAYVAKVLGAQRFGIAHETEAYGAYLTEVMEETAPEVGAGVAGRWSFDPADPRLDARLAAIAGEVSAANGPAVLVLAMQPEAGVALVKHLRDRGFDGELVVTDALASQAFADGFRAFPEERSGRGFYTDGIYASTPFLFDTAGRRAADFLRAYVARYDRGPDWFAAFAADAAAVLVEAMRRAGLSPVPETIAEDRSKLREALAAIGRHIPVAGITGPTSFDASRNAEKPVPMGRFLNGEILSAFVQLRLLPGLRRLEDLDAAHQAARVVKLGDRFLYRTDVARVGVRARRFGKLDFTRGTFEMDFDVWFRHQADRGVEQIEFTNAVEPISLGDPVDELLEGRLQYRLYRVRGLFRADILDAPYGGHALALSLRHRERVRQDLVLALDTLGMNLGRASARSERGAPARRLLGATSNWAIDDLLFFESEVDEPALGHPGYLGGARSARPFSQLTLGVILRPRTTGLRGIVPRRYQLQLLALALAASALLLFAGRGGSSRLRFLLQAAFALLLLMTVEPVLGNWLNGSAKAPQLAQLTRLFDVLWWMLPAFLVTVAIQRFVWRPAEARSGTPVPTLLRYFVAFIIFMLAFFGIVAFVFDYRLTGLLATSGVLAMIIGLAVQLNITNIFAGVALNLERPFRVGDWIMIHGRTPDPDASVIGMVIDINWRTTRLKTVDDTEIVIPNGVISEKTITNFNAPSEMSRFQLYFTVDQSVPHERVIDVIQAGVNAVIGTEKGGPVAEPPPKVRIDQVNETGIVYVVRYRLLPSEVSPRQARHTINESVLRQLREAGIELAYPGRRIYEARTAKEQS
jgi:branched-chain amino acid transport system substrate-binding protein